MPIYFSEHNLYRPLTRAQSSSKRHVEGSVVNPQSRHDADCQQHSSSLTACSPALQTLPAAGGHSICEPCSLCTNTASVSEEHNTSTFRAEVNFSQEPSEPQTPDSHYHTLRSLSLSLSLSLELSYATASVLFLCFFSVSCLHPFFISSHAYSL
jgi:hypothetical protein